MYIICFSVNGLAYALLESFSAQLFFPRFPQFGVPLPALCRTQPPAAEAGGGLGQH